MFASQLTPCFPEPKLICRRTPQACTPQPDIPSRRALSLSFTTMVVIAAMASIALPATPVLAQDSVPVVTGVPRVDKLLSQMTIDEKMALIRGASEDPATNQGQAGYLIGVPRLGIPPIRMSDGPPGVLTRNPSMGETATMGVAATFSVKDAE